jgi:sporulation protein YlmC with PRC-barrel domain
MRSDRVGDSSRSRLIKLSKATPALGTVEPDVRGRYVQSVDGESIGTVDDLLVDIRERQVRFLEVRSVGFPGSGKRKALIPIEAAIRLGEHIVHLDRTLAYVDAAPVYNPHVGLTDLYLSEIYEYYGYQPPWTPQSEPR